MGVLYLKLLSTNLSLCMQSFVLLTQSARFVRLTAPLWRGYQCYREITVTWCNERGYQSVARLPVVRLPCG